MSKINSFLSFRTLLLIIAICFTTVGYSQWTTLDDVPFINDHSNGFGHNGKGYVIKGSESNNSGQLQNRLWEYDPVTDKWSAIGFAPGASRSVAIGDDMDGKYYFGFGFGRNDVWEYDPENNTFAELPSCPCPGRAHPAFVAHNSKIFMGSGSGSNGDLNDWWVFDFSTQSWSQKDDIPGPNRHHPYQFGIEDAIYVGGGHQSSWHKFDIITETWSEMDDFPHGRVAGSQFSYEGNGFVISGDDIQHAPLKTQQFLMYDPGLDEWYDLPFEESMHRWAPSSFIY